MDRKRYLELCREVAALPGGIEDVKPDVPDYLRVVYDGAEYYPVKYELGFDRSGNAMHTAVIHELRANAWYYVPLGKVEEKET